MWCSQCQQDVPAVAQPGDDHAIRCARCGQVVPSNAGVPPSPLPESGPADAAPAPDELTADDEPVEFFELSDWELERQCERVDRITQSLRVVIPRPSSDEPITGPNLGRPSAFRVDLAPHEPIPASHHRSRHVPFPRRRWHTALVWASWSIGMMAFLCGAVVLGVGVLESRTDLWSIGLPLALVGQALLLLGIILQLDRLSQSDRATQQSLAQLDDDIHRVQRATTLLGTSHSAPGQSFYLHLAQGASPQALLVDLKGQLDLLASQLAEASDRPAAG